MLATALFFLLGIVTSPICWIVHRLAGHHLSPRVGQNLLCQLSRFHIATMQRLGILQIETYGFETLRDLRGTVLVANHPALFDAFLLLAHLPPAACVMRASLLRNPALCGTALLAGYVTNDSGPGFVRQGIAKLRAGENLLVFAEGTRTLQPPLNRFRHGFAMVAARAGTTVQTLVIDYSGTHLTKGVSIFAPMPAPMKFALRVGARFVPEPAESPAAFSQRIETWFRRELEGTKS
jgi:1-acyl-sn-glycerol-3-phosphate acyltransferase